MAPEHTSTLQDFISINSVVLCNCSTRIQHNKQTCEHNSLCFWGSMSTFCVFPVKLHPQTNTNKHLCMCVLPAVGLGEESASVLRRDELNSLRWQTFDVSDVPAGQSDVSGLIPHLGDRRRQEEVKKLHSHLNMMKFNRLKLTCLSSPSAGESVSRQMCSSGSCLISLSLCVVTLKSVTVASL